MFAQLKKWEVLQGGSVDSITVREKELDVALALTNLNTRARLGLLGAIATRVRFASNPHSITSEIEQEISIPKPMKPTDAKFPAHLKQFMEALPSLAPTLHKLAIADRGFDVFTTRTLQRGRNLFSGGSVLQFGVQPLPLDVWRLRWIVGASMKVHKYVGYADFSKNGVVQSVCECQAGYVRMIGRLHIRYRLNLIDFFVCFFFFREAKCSHLCASIHLLDHLSRNRNDIQLVILCFQCAHLLLTSKDNSSL